MYEIYKNQLQRNQLYSGLCQIAKQLDSGVVIIDPLKDFTIVYANHVFTEMTEYSDHELIGSKLTMLQGPLSDSEQEQVFLDSLQNFKSIKTTIFHYRKDGSAFWHELSSLPIHDEQGIVQFHYITSNDITSIVNMEALVLLEREVYTGLEQGDELSVIFEHICKYVEMKFQKNAGARFCFLRAHS